MSPREAMWFGPVASLIGVIFVDVWIQRIARSGVLNFDQNEATKTQKDHQTTKKVPKQRRPREEDAESFSCPKTDSSAAVTF